MFVYGKNDQDEKGEAQAQARLPVPHGNSWGKTVIKKTTGQKTKAT